MRLTPRLTECLIEIKRLEEERKISSNKKISQKLNLHPSTITELFQKLALLNLVTYDQYHGVRLTIKGDELSELILRKHRLSERFLVDFLGFEPKEACSASSNFDKYVPDEVIDSICKKLNHPEICPCGKPIIKGRECEK
jgi:DtxR family Mn-dependent transcriptional regulator